MRRWFTKEADLEHWLKPFTGMVMVPGNRREHMTETRLFFDLYWQLLCLGYGEDQLAEYVIRKRWETHPPMPEGIAFVKMVFWLAEHKGLSPSKKFTPLFAPEHPRDVAKGSKSSS